MGTFDESLGAGSHDAGTSVPPSGLSGPPLELELVAGGADRIAVVDCETTGVYNTDRVVEVAVITLDLAGQVIDSWDSLVQPNRDVGPTYIHGLTAASLRGAPTFDQIAGDLALRLHGACIAAHNLPFDQRMLTNEFDRLGTELSVIAGLDTLTATSSRLGVACHAYGIQHTGAHSALGDADATAQLLLRVLTECKTGAAAAAPIELARSGRVLRRGDMTTVDLPETSAIARLAAALDLAGLEANMLAYLELVSWALGDLHLDAHEDNQLNTLAATLGLNGAQRAQAHRRFVNDLVDAALEDDVVTPEEYDALFRVASALGVDAKLVEQRTRTARATALTVQLTEGMTVVFTGDDPRQPRSDLTAHAHQLGMIVGKGITKSTDLLVAFEPESNSGKAGKARTYNVPIVSTGQFGPATLGDSLEAHGSSIESVKVVTCPDCRATWTVPARAGAHAKVRCDGCRSIEAASQRLATGAPGKPPD